jgi:hypothetical protein
MLYYAQLWEIQSFTQQWIILTSHHQMYGLVMIQLWSLRLAGAFYKQISEVNFGIVMRGSLKMNMYLQNIILQRYFQMGMFISG